MAASFSADTPRVMRALATEAVLLERIAECLRIRRWYRRTHWADWPDLRKENEVELRALVKLARRARQVAAPDPVDVAKAEAERRDAYEGQLAGWAPGELVEMYGR